MRYFPRWVLAILLLYVGAARAANGTATGRLLFVEGAQTLTPGEASSEPMSLEFRRGDDVIAVQLAKNGAFRLSGPPGEYELTYVRVGPRVEFFSPVSLKLMENRTVCVGTLELSLKDVRAELGSNVENQLEIKPGCGGSGGKASDEALAKRVPEPPHEKPWQEYPAGLRASLDLFGAGSQLRVGYAYAFHGSLSDPGSFVAYLHGEQSLSSTTPNRRAVLVGAGYMPFNFLELAAGGQIPAGGGANPGVYGHVRVGGVGAGIGLLGKVPFGGVPELFLTLDVAPLAVLGALL